MGADKGLTTLPPWFLAELAGIEDPRDADLAGQILAALESISPDLVPRVVRHPLLLEISRGVRALPGLLERFDAARAPEEGAVILDAIAEIAAREHATHEVVARLEGILAAAKDERVASVAARALACARAAPFLEHQRNLLGSADPSEVRVASRLLGYGKYERAVPVLLEILRADNMVAADAVIWALGEIGHPDATAMLHMLVSKLLFVEDAIEAAGKIGSRASVVRIMPLLSEGAAKQRERAAEALVRILRKNDGTLGDPGLDEAIRGAVHARIDSDPSPVVRYFALVAYSLLGGHLEPSRVLAALGGRLSQKELDAVGALLVPKPATSSSTKKGRKRGPPV